MNRRWSNIFFLFGVAAVIVMLLTFDTDWTQLRSVLSDAGIWFPVIVLLWGFIYIVNACSFNLIINDGRGPGLFWKRCSNLRCRAMRSTMSPRWV